MVRNLSGLLVVLISFSASMAFAEEMTMDGISWGGVGLQIKDVRSYDQPTDIDPGALTALSTRDGKTLLYATVGSARDISCTVLLASDQSATRFDYKYDDNPTECISVLPHPSGGFFVRGRDPTAIMGEVKGFTAYVDASGVQQWVLEDQKLVDARSQADNGTGEFLGAYDKPHPAMAYSARFDKLMAFTDGRLTIGAQGKSISQAHVIDVPNGRLRRSGLNFGDNTLGVVGGLIDRQSDGYFLLYLFATAEQGAYFYTFDGRIKINKFEPLGEDWSTRVITSMVYGPEERLTLLWTPNSDTGADTRVTAVNDQGNALWNEQWPSVINTNDGPLDIGRPRSMWVGKDHVAVLHIADQKLIIRVIDAQTGNQWGVARLDDVTEQTPLAILNGKDGELKLLAYDETAERFTEFELSFTDQPDPMAQPMMPDMGLQPDMDVPDIPGVTSDGCDCAQVDQRRHMPAYPLMLLLGSLGFVAWRRRQSGIEG